MKSFVRKGNVKNIFLLFFNLFRQLFKFVFNIDYLGLAPVDPDCPQKEHYHVYTEVKTKFRKIKYVFWTSKGSLFNAEHEYFLIKL